MKSVQKILSRTSAQSFFKIGAATLLLGLVCRVATHFYGRYLFQVMVSDAKAMKGSDFSFEDAISEVRFGNALSYILLFCGVAILLAGVVRDRKPAYGRR